MSKYKLQGKKKERKRKMLSINDTCFDRGTGPSFFFFFQWYWQWLSLKLYISPPKKLLRKKWTHNLGHFVGIVRIKKYCETKTGSNDIRVVHQLEELSPPVREVQAKKCDHLSWNVACVKIYEKNEGKKLSSANSYSLLWLDYSIEPFVTWL